jgi:hypothetical protein
MALVPFLRGQNSGSLAGYACDAYLGDPEPLRKAGGSWKDRMRARF